MGSRETLQGKIMVAEFEKQLSQFALDDAAKAKIVQMISDAGKEYPCLSCPSKDDCASFKWFLKWFGT